MIIMPSFFVIGVQKCGTTSLSQYLPQHPRIVCTKYKEVNYFDQDINYAKGDEWYGYHFDFPGLESGAAVSFEASPETIYFPYCAERLHRYNPEAKLIAILRDPVERAYSAWDMFTNFKDHRAYRHLAEHRTFDEAVSDEMQLLDQGRWYGMPVIIPGYVARGLYHQQILRFLKYFPVERLYITENTVLKSEPVRVMNEITGFLGLPAFDWKNAEFEPCNKGIYNNAPMSQERRRILSDFFKPHNEELFRLLGRRFDWS